MKRLSIIIVFLCWWAIAFSQETYLPAFELPDLIKCLPAPPEKGTPAFKYDVQRYRWGKAQRSNPSGHTMRSWTAALHPQERALPGYLLHIPGILIDSFI